VNRVTDRTYTMNGTRYLVVIIDTDTDRVISAPGFHWADGDYSFAGTLSEEWLMECLAGHKVRRGDRGNLCACILAALDQHVRAQKPAAGVEP